MGLVLAGVLLGAAAGCLSGSPQTSTSSPAAKPKPKVVAGGVRKVAAGIFEALADAGVVVVEKRQDEEVRLVGAAPSGKMFAVVLRPARAGDGTEIAVAWGGEPDKQVARILRQTLEEMRPRADDGPDDSPPPAQEQAEK
jgi:hypothetical protein